MVNKLFIHHVSKKLRRGSHFTVPGWRKRNYGTSHYLFPRGRDGCVEELGESHSFQKEGMGDQSKQREYKRGTKKIDGRLIGSRGNIRILQSLMGQVSLS